MIKNITIKGLASFDKLSGVSFEPTLINYIYGANGSGKTTISNVLDGFSNYTNCIIDWGHNSPLDTLVYNKTFVEENFEQSNELKGIFTLGKESKDELEKIKYNQTQIEIKDKATLELKKSHDIESLKLQELENNFIEKCWVVYKKYEESFVKAFEGYRHSKQKFKEKVIEELKSNEHPLYALTELQNNANKILNETAVLAQEIVAPDVHDLKGIEENPIFQEVILGKGDVDIAKMILNLNNSDWIRQGIQYYKSNNEFCPFCQQLTEEKFIKQLDEYFDVSYTEQINSLKGLKFNYEARSNSFLALFDFHRTFSNHFINLEELARLKEIISSIFQANMLIIDTKLKEPTTKCELINTSVHINEFISIVEQAILKTKDHNNLVRNIDKEKKLLISNIWAFIISELKGDCLLYNSDKIAIEKGITSLAQKIFTTASERKVFVNEIQKSESLITSVKPTINAINKTLTGFGFTNFSLSEANTPGCYMVIRENGQDAKSTLSEGEKTFITFLYYYHLTNGSFRTDNISTKKVLVIDDPISSLDSSVLFIVSNLVRKLIDDCRKNTNNIKQIFVLTHNVYFHKEVTFQKQGVSNKGESFWIIRRIGNKSAIDKYENNPIQTSYDLLWQEIRDKSKINKLTVYNTLRRILEYYFKILGKVKDDDLINKFDGENKIISSSLLSWINDGSHSINDDIFIASDDETVEKYLRVFKNIFVTENQIDHYNMMMKLQ